MDVHDVESHPYRQDFNDCPNQRRARLKAQSFWAETLLQSERNTADEDIGNECHDWDVEVWCIQFVPWLQRFIWIVLDRPILNYKAEINNRLLKQLRKTYSMREWEEKKNQLFGYVSCVD